VKILVALIHHESNSFNPNLTNLKEFEILRNNEVLQNRNTFVKSSLKGIIDTLAKEEIEIIPTVVVLPKAEGGLIEESTYQTIRSLYIEEIKKHKEIDGICLALHGSMTTEKKLDVEGEILALTRKHFGDKIPITAALDMHAMISKKIVENVDALVAYRTAPHIDKYETGVKAAELLVRNLYEGINLKMKAIQIPILLSGEMSKTDEYPMKNLIKNLEKKDKLEGVLSTSYFLGFPWADLEFNNASAVVVAEDAKLAEKIVFELAEEFWKYKKEFDFTVPAFNLADSLEFGKTDPAAPLFIIDSGDNPGAGSTQNDLTVLKYLLDKSSDFNKLLYGSINLPELVNYSYQLGEKKQLKFKINFEGEPVLIKGNIEKLREYKGVRSVLVVFNDLYLVFSDQKVVMQDPEFMHSLNLDLSKFKIVMLKSGYLSPEYQNYSKKTILALTPGYTYQVFEKLEYNNLKRPIYPLNKDFEPNFTII